MHFRTFSKDTFLRLDIMFQVRCSQPDLDTLADVLNSAREDDLRVVIGLSCKLKIWCAGRDEMYCDITHMQSRCLQPDILVLLTLFATLLDKLPCCDHSSRMFF